MDSRANKEDNQACVYASESKHVTRNLRHLDLAQLRFKEKVADGTCFIVKVDSKENKSDIGTKRNNLIDKSLKFKYSRIKEFINCNKT